tara:strand:- start:328 stop:621 length:294 start_codon:yes stop_codon:yes gene_type:complete
MDGRTLDIAGVMRLFFFPKYDHTRHKSKIVLAILQVLLLACSSKQLIPIILEQEQSGVLAPGAYFHDPLTQQHEVTHEQVCANTIFHHPSIEDEGQL